MSSLTHLQRFEVESIDTAATSAALAAQEVVLRLRRMGVLDSGPAVEP